MLLNFSDVVTNYNHEQIIMKICGKHKERV
jgi:hypothetical protein